MNYTRIIKNETEYETALEEIGILIGNDPSVGTQEADRLELLALLVKTYEETHYPMEFPTVIEAVRFRMEQDGLKQNDLATIIGSKGRVSEMLNGKRAVSFSMAKALHKRLGIPAEIFLRDEAEKIRKAA
ncbi:MAG: helix-turn-helix domain-containing protein [Desulfuromonadaceae bacterium]|nr:helix-turn-helix domain-containing protein [Desulfuromonadaceae bacterium]